MTGDGLFEKRSRAFGANRTAGESIPLPGLNRGVMCRAALELCELAAIDQWIEFLARYDAETIGLYSLCHDNHFEFSEFREWEPGLDLRAFLRKRVPPSFGLKTNGALTAASLSILLKIRGPVYSLPAARSGLRDAIRFAQSDFDSGRIELAIFTYAASVENLTEMESESLPLGASIAAQTKDQFALPFASEEAIFNAFLAGIQ